MMVQPWWQASSWVLAGFVLEMVLAVIMGVNYLRTGSFTGRKAR